MWVPIEVFLMSLLTKRKEEQRESGVVFGLFHWFHLLPYKPQSTKQSNVTETNLIVLTFLPQSLVFLFRYKNLKSQSMILGDECDSEPGARHQRAPESSATRWRWGLGVCSHVLVRSVPAAGEGQSLGSRMQRGEGGSSRDWWAMQAVNVHRVCVCVGQ